MLIAPPPPPATAARPVAFYDTECFPNYWLLKLRPRGGQAYSFRLRAGQAFDQATAASIRLLFEAYTTVSFNGNYYDVPMITAALIGYTAEQLKWLNDRIIVEVSATGTAIREYAWLDDLPVAVLDGSVNQANPSLFWVHADHLNRPVLMTDVTTAKVWQAHYEPFGAVHSITGPAANDNRFPGQLFQLETGLAYNWHRHYDAAIGRYVSADPLGLQTLLSDGPSVYGYAAQSPLINTDPTGQFAPLVVGAGVAAAYFLTPSTANAPGPDDIIVPNNDADPFLNAATTAACLSPHYWWSWRSRGGGARMWKDGPGVDWHRFKKNGDWVNRPYYHRGDTKSQMKKHRPWDGGW